MKRFEKFVGLTMSPELLDRLDALCHKHRVSRSKAIRIALDVWTTHMEPLPPAYLKDEDEQKLGVSIG